MKAKIESVKSPTEGMERVLWAVADIFRASSPSAGVAFHVIVLAFLKLLADIYRDRATRDVKDWAQVWLELKIPDRLSWDDLCGRRWSYEIGLFLDELLQEIEFCNSSILSGAFSGISFDDLSRNSSSGHVIVDALQAMSGVDLRPSRFDEKEDLGNFFENSFFMLAEPLGLSSEEFYVPPGLSALLANLLDPQAGESMLDPACGSGLLLGHLARHVGLNHGCIWGQDWRRSSLSLCKMAFVSQGLSPSGIELSNSLRTPLRDSAGNLLKANVVVSNPPFGLNHWDGKSIYYERPELMEYGLAPKSSSELAFLCHMLAAAHEKRGRVGAVIPQGVLFRGGEREFRRYLIEANLLVGIIALPPNMFYATAIPVALLFLDKGKTTTDIMFVDASRSCKADGRLNRLAESEITRISEVFRSFESLPGFSRCVSPEEVKKQDFQLMVTRYVAAGKEKAGTKSIEDLSREVERTENELTAVEEEINRVLKSLGVSVG